MEDPIPDSSSACPSPSKEMCFLVYESALLLLFTTCAVCNSHATNIKKVVKGSFLRITQLCSSCKYQRVWESQPFIGKTPAGNILTSAAILFAGSLPAKVLRIFGFINCSMITLRTFFRHQEMYLKPAVNLTWEQHQKALLETLKRRNGALVVAGDGRCDSPGHCAKYGTYSLVELTCNKVVNFKLIQVS